jgi:hypothetical protein
VWDRTLWYSEDRSFVLDGAKRVEVNESFCFFRRVSAAEPYRGGRAASRSGRDRPAEPPTGISLSVCHPDLDDVLSQAQKGVTFVEFSMVVRGVWKMFA